MDGEVSKLQVNECDSFMAEEADGSTSFNLVARYRCKRTKALLSKLVLLSE